MTVQMIIGTNWKMSQWLQQEQLEQRSNYSARIHSTNIIFIMYHLPMLLLYYVFMSL